MLGKDLEIAGEKLSKRVVNRLEGPRQAPGQHEVVKAEIARRGANAS